MGARTLFRAAAALCAGVLVASCTGSSTAPSVPGTSVAAPGSPVASAGQLPTPEKTDIVIGESGDWTTGNLHAAMIDYYKLGKRFGFNLTFQSFSGGSQVVQALIAGQVDVSDNSGGPVIASLITDVPLEIAFVTQDNITDNLYSAHDVTTAAQLKGKNVAISSFGSQSNAGALLALKSLGLTDKDVTITQVGNDAARLAALKGGSVAASINDANQERNLTALGFNVLVHLTDVKGLGGVPLTSLTVTKAFAQKYPNTTLDLTAMWLEGLQMYRAHPDAGATALASLAQLDPNEATTEVTDFLNEPFHPLDGRCDPTVMQFTKQVLLAANPDVANVDPTQACTNEFLDKLDQLGWKPDTTVPTQ